MKGQLHFGSREKRAVPVMAILQAGSTIGGTLIKGINELVDVKRAISFNNALKMVAKAIMPALDDLKSRFANTNQKLTSQYRMM